MRFKIKVATLYDRPDKKELDKLWRECALLKYGNKRGNYCEYPNCKKTDYLNVHHIYTRSHYSTRWDIDNAMILCSGCHSLNTNSAHHDPDFKEIIIANGIRTREFYDKLRMRAFTPAKNDLNLIKIALEQEIKKLKIC